MKAFIFALCLVYTSIAQGDEFDDAYAAAQAGDYETAFSLWKPLAENGDSDAQYFIGLMYVNGDGVERDFIEGAQWYLEAAEQGNARAQNNLANMFATGQGIPQDLVRGHAWYQLAALQRYREAEINLAIIETLMTADQIAEAEALAEQWMQENN